jgi:hypothetical protein
MKIQSCSVKPYDIVFFFFFLFTFFILFLLSAVMLFMCVRAEEISAPVIIF